jgi:hypothetical protein
MIGLMRPEKAAALANFLLIPLLTLLLMVFTLTSDTHAVAIAYPVKHAFKNIAYAILAMLISTPLAAVAAWRTWIHAQRVVAREGTAWRGVVEAAAFGFLLTLPFILPILIARLFDPGRWSRVEAVSLGAAYIAAYGLIGAVIGFALGLLLLATASLVLRFAPAPIVLPPDS